MHDSCPLLGQVHKRFWRSNGQFDGIEQVRTECGCLSCTHPLEVSTRQARPLPAGTLHMNGLQRACHCGNVCPPQLSPCKCHGLHAAFDQCTCRCRKYHYAPGMHSGFATQFLTMCLSLAASGGGRRRCFCPRDHACRALQIFSKKSSQVQVCSMEAVQRPLLM